MIIILLYYLAREIAQPVKCVQYKYEALSSIPAIHVHPWSRALLRSQCWTGGYTRTLGHLRASGPTERQTLFQNARWTAPEEQRQRLTSDLHMHIHACAPVLIITDIKLRKISE